MAVHCPNCGFPHAPGLESCGRCGVVFARLDRSAAATRRLAKEVPLPVPRADDDGGDDRWAWRDPAARRALIQGGVAALAISLIPFLRFVFGHLVILIHEFGHAVTGWLFGYPSIPAFDFAYGGGVTVHQDRSFGLVVILAVGWAVLAWLTRRSRPVFSAAGSVAGLWAFLAFTRLHEILQIAMGHGAELILAGLFLYRAMDGEACRIPAERPLYAFCGVFVLLHDVVFAWGLMTSPLQRDLYEDAKGGGHWMDFSRLAEEFLRADLRTVAVAFLAACLVVPAIALLAHRYKREIVEAAERLAREAA